MPYFQLEDSSTFESLELDTAAFFLKKKKKGIFHQPVLAIRMQCIEIWVQPDLAAF